MDLESSPPPEKPVPAPAIADEPPVPTQEEPTVEPPVPATVRALGVVLWVQAAVCAVSTLIAFVAYFVRGADHLGLGSYATARTHPAPMLIVGVAVTGLLVWFARRLPSRPVGLHRLIRIAEVVLVVDAALSLLAGIFNVWSVAGLLAAVAALWYLRADDTTDYLF